MTIQTTRQPGEPLPLVSATFVFEHVDYEPPDGRGRRRLRVQVERIGDDLVVATTSAERKGQGIILPRMAGEAIAQMFCTCRR